MTTLREAAQQALEALQAYGSHAPNCDYLVLLTSLPPQRKPCSCGLGANITALRAALAEPMEPVNKTPAWWMNGLTATLMREGVNKHRAKEIAKGYWEAYCQVPMDEEEPK